MLDHGKLRLTTSPLLYRCDPIWSWRESALSESALLLVLDGRGSIRIEDKERALRKGVCLFLRPGLSIEVTQRPAYPLFIFLARFEMLDQRGAPHTPHGFTAAPRPILVRDIRRLESMADLVFSYSLRASPGSESLVIDSLSLLMRIVLEESRRGAASFDANVYEALQSIEQDLARKWSVSDLAQIAQQSPRKFARSFRSMMGEPPIRYVIRRRMAEARRQIQLSSLPISEIAANLGYPDAGLFRELFEKHVGSRPESTREGRSF